MEAYKGDDITACNANNEVSHKRRNVLDLIEMVVPSAINIKNKFKILANSWNRTSDDLFRVAFTLPPLC